MKISTAVTFLLISMSATTVQADNDPNRNVSCVAQKIVVTETQFRLCFLPVNPDRAHRPSGEVQKANKAKLLPCLQAANSRLSNSVLDRAMDSCRPEGPIGRG